MRNLFTVLAICSSTIAHAQGDFRCNENGAIVTLSDGTIYYLGNDCDAVQKGIGSGNWWLSASAFVVEIGGKAKRLPFEVDCDLPACWANG